MQLFAGISTQKYSQSYEPQVKNSLKGHVSFTPTLNFYIKDVFLASQMFKNKGTQ